jgi:hypothetical protein
VDADQLTSILVAEMALAVTLEGALGGVVSGVASVVALAAFDWDDEFPAASNACTL